MYESEVREGLMPSFMLAPLGEDMSTISRHLFSWCRLGMIPMGLIWVRQGKAFAGKGPRMRFASSSDLGSLPRLMHVLMLSSCFLWLSEYELRD